MHLSSDGGLRLVPEPDWRRASNPRRRCTTNRVGRGANLHMILIVDDDPSVTASLALRAEAGGLCVARGVVAGRGPRLAGARGVRPRPPGHELLAADVGRGGARTVWRASGRMRPDVAGRSSITAWGSIALAVAGMKAGASDFVTKPWTNEQVLQSVRTVLGVAASRCPRRPARLCPAREELDARYDFGGLVGNDPRLLRILEIIGRVSCHGRLGADHRRERHGQGTGRRGDPPQQPSPARRVRQGEPRRDLVDAVRERDVRPRPGSVHRRAGPTGRAGSSWRTAARSSSTRSATSTPPRR